MKYCFPKKNVDTANPCVEISSHNNLMSVTQNYIGQMQFIILWDYDTLTVDLTL